MKLSIEQKLKLKLEQKLLISQLQIQVLIMPVEELEIMLDKEKDDNPFLEDYRESDENASSGDTENQVAEYEYATFDHLEETEHSESTQELPYLSDITSDFQQKGEAIRRESDIRADATYLYESIVEQIYSRFEDDKKRVIAFEIFNSLDFKGYLARSVEDIAKELRNLGFDVSESEVEEVRKEFMELEPLGMGSKNPSEYLSFVLKKLIDDRRMGSEIPTNLIDDLKEKHPEFFELLEKLGKAFDRAKAQMIRDLAGKNDLISRLLERVRDKDIPPFPLFGLNIKSTPLFARTPDVEVEVHDDEIYIYINTPTVHVRDLRKEQWFKKIQDIDKATKKVISEKLRRAKELERGLKMRYEIIHKVVKHIASHQKEFLKTGDQKLIKPLTLEDLSNMCNLSISMISRAIKGKIIKTPVGLLELKDLLSHNVAGRSKTKEVSQKMILEEIKSLILNEDKENPLSDHDISQLLKDKLGVELARRTIVKYRKKLGIANLEERKSMYQKIY